MPFKFNPLTGTLDLVNSSGGSGSGDVTGPSSSTDSHVTFFNGTTGKIIKDSGLTLSGTNTGDEDATSIKTKLGITTLSGSNTGDQDLSSYALTSAVHNVPSGGTSNQVLAKNSNTDYDLKWYTVSAGSGDVVGPSSSTDAHIALFDGVTGKLLKDSSHLLSEYALLTGAAFTGQVKVTRNNTTYNLATVANAHYVLDNTASSNGQTMFTWAFGGTAVGGLRGDSTGNFNYFATGSQGFQFYHSLDTSSPAMGLSSTGLLLTSVGGIYVASERLDVRGNAKVTGNVYAYDAGSYPVAQASATYMRVNDVARLVDYGNLTILVRINSIDIVDMTQPTVPVILSTITGFNDVLDCGACIAGKYLVAGEFAGRVVKWYDLTNPASPVLVKTLDVSAQLSNPRTICASGKFVYVGSRDDTKMIIIDCGDVNNPIITGSIAWTGQLPFIQVQGNYVYAALYSSGTCKIVDVSDPTTPTVVSTINVGVTANWIELQGDYAHIMTNTGFQTWNVADPANPFYVGGAYGSAGTYGYLIAGLAYGRYLITSDAWYYNTRIYDVANPVSPVLLHTIASAYSYNFGVRKNYFYWIDSGGSDVGKLKVYDLGRTEATTGVFSSLYAGNSMFQGTAYFNKEIYAMDKIMIGNGGLTSGGDLVSAKSVYVPEGQNFYIGNVPVSGGGTSFDVNTILSWYNPDTSEWELLFDEDGNLIVSS